MAFEEKPHWLKQIFDAAVSQTADFLTRSPQQRMFDALMNGKFGQVKRLINSGKVDINSRDPHYGRTPIMAAVNWGIIFSHLGEPTGHIKIIRFLLTKFPDLAAVDNDGNDVWAIAEKKGGKKILAMLPPKPPSVPKTASPAP